MTISEPEINEAHMTAEPEEGAPTLPGLENDPHLLDPGYNLTLRPMRYPDFYEMYRAAIRNTWTVEEVDFSSDITDLQTKLSDAEQHLVKRLVAFFATGDTIVSNNLVINLYQHINSPEARLYLSRQLFEEAQHVQFYLTLLDTYIPDHRERNEMFRAVETIPSIKRKAEFCYKYIDSTFHIEMLETPADRRKFLLNLICFATCIEGMFFFAAFAYVYFLRSKGLLNGLASGTNWVFRDESCHMEFALAVIEKVREEEPTLFDDSMRKDVEDMIAEAIECEFEFAQDVLTNGIPGLPLAEVRQYLEFVADRRFAMLGMPAKYNVKNPFEFMNLQDVQELSNFFERRVSAYQTAVEGEVDLNEDF